MMALWRLLILILFSFIRNINAQRHMCFGTATRCDCPPVPRFPNELCILEFRDTYKTSEIRNIMYKYVIYIMISCGMEDLCLAKNLNCRASSPCLVECDAKATCSSGATINGISSTDVTILCDKVDACKGLQTIWCGTGKCILICKSSTSCEQIGRIDVSKSQSFECYGHCPPNVPPPFIRTTAQPTPPPTVRPTQFPSRAPTKFPTNMPTRSPTTNPTRSPSNYPTLSPTRNPSVAPTKYPTHRPTRPIPGILTRPPQTTRKPTRAMPTYRPTYRPTRRPSYHPTPGPTDVPTKRPSDKPSFTPTRSPSAKPTLDPSSSPTLRPTQIPSVHPTANPSQHPTEHITTMYPSNAPSASPLKIFSDVFGDRQGKEEGKKSDGSTVLTVIGVTVLILFSLCTVKMLHAMFARSESDAKWYECKQIAEKLKKRKEEIIASVSR